MTKLIVAVEGVAPWQALILAGQEKRLVQLSEELESYLTFLLMRFLTDPAVGSEILAVDYLNAMGSVGSMRASQLRDLGDKCLFLSGFFPQLALRKQVNVAYFVNLGRSAYQNLAQQKEVALSDLYEKLSFSFILLLDILNAIREMSEGGWVLLPMEAQALWANSPDAVTRKIVERYTHACPILGLGDYPTQ